MQHVCELGVFRTGLWSEYAWSDRYQTPADPRTWVDAAVPNFHETFGTTTLQPYAEYELRVTPVFSITPGFKLAYYKQNFTQYADNGKIVGNLNGAPFVKHAVTYHAALPSIDGRYLLQSNWSVYGQYGRGQNIPPTERLRREERSGRDAAQADSHRHRAIRLGVEVTAGDARCRRVPHQLPGRLLVDNRPGLG